jgi:acetyl-CoA C-acetyltransferase
MESKESVYIAGAYEHPTREAPDKSQEQLHAEVAEEALIDAGIKHEKVDGYLTSGVPEYTYALVPIVMADYLGLEVNFADGTNYGGSSYPAMVNHAANAIRSGMCDICLITQGNRPASAESDETGTGTRPLRIYQDSFERIYGMNIVSMYAMAAKRHMHEFGTTSEQLAEVREAASYHAQYNENAKYPNPVSVEEVVNSDYVAEPLHLYDCCMVSDGGGALVVVSEDVQEDLDRECVEVLGGGEYIKHQNGGEVDLTYTGARYSGPEAFKQAGLEPDEIDYASIYDSFTITVIETLEDLGFCKKGEGGEFVEDGALKSPDGKLPFNTDGGGLANNHPDRGGMIRTIEAVRQLRGEANSEVQVPDAEHALVHGTGGDISTRHASATLILGGESQ